MSGVKIIDGTRLFEFTAKAIITENFEKAKEWIINYLDPRFDGTPEQIIGTENSKTGNLYYWGKREMDEFKDVINKLEALYKKVVI
jgi:hypothetical protein